MVSVSSTRGDVVSMNIKNPDVHALAADLARLRGVSLTQAVLDAVRNELERERQRRCDKGLAVQLVEIGKRCAAHLKGPVRSTDHGTMLYDDSGLPE